MPLVTLQNFYEGLITTAIDAGDLKVYVSVLPTPTEGWAVINSGNAQKREIIYYSGTGTDGGGDYLTLTLRGLGGTTDQSHDINEPIRLNITAEHWAEVDAEMTSLQTQLDEAVLAGAPNASTTIKGISKLSTAPASATEPIAVGDNDPRLIQEPPQTINFPELNQYYFNFSTDILATLTGTTTSLFFNHPDTYPQTRTMTSDWADVNSSYSAVLLDNYLYVLMRNTTPDPDQWRIYRYNALDLSAGGTQITFSGQGIVDTNLTLYMATDGTDIYINYDGGNSANDYEISKYTISGTVFTYDSKITCGSTAGTCSRILVNTNGIYGLTFSGNYITKIIKFNFSGVEQSNSGTIITVINVVGLMTYAGYFYTLKNNADEVFCRLYVE